MYHIKDDIRMKRSADKILSALLSCMKTKNFASVTFSDLQRASGVGRSTVYRLFDSTVDILSYGCDLFAENLNRKFKAVLSKSPTPREFALFSFGEWMNESELLYSVIASRRGDVLERALVKHRMEFRAIGHFDIDEVQQQYVKEGLAALLAAILKVWIRNGKKETPEQLVNLFEMFSKNLE